MRAWGSPCVFSGIRTAGGDRSVVAVQPEVAQQRDLGAVVDQLAVECSTRTARALSAQGPSAGPQGSASSSSVQPRPGQPGGIRHVELRERACRPSRRSRRSGSRPRDRRSAPCTRAPSTPTTRWASRQPIVVTGAGSGPASRSRRRRRRGLRPLGVGLTPRMQAPGAGGRLPVVLGVGQPLEARAQLAVPVRVDLLHEQGVQGGRCRRHGSSVPTKQDRNLSSVSAILGP